MKILAFAKIMDPSFGIPAYLSWQNHVKSTDFKSSFSEILIHFCVSILPSHRTASHIFTFFFSIVCNIEVNPCHLHISIFEELSSLYKQTISNFVVKPKIFHFIAIIWVELKHETQTEKSFQLYHVTQYTVTQATGLKRKFGACHMIHIF
jgi:hypothetical protein